MEYLPHLRDLTRFIGDRLDILARGDLLIDGEQNFDDLGPLELVFQSGSTIQLRLVSDGESIDFRLFNTRPPDLLGQAGNWPRVDLTLHPEYQRLCQQKLGGIDGIYFGYRPEGIEVLAGLIFNFESGDSLAYYNAGDFAKIYLNASPPTLPEPFYLAVRNVLVSG